MSVQGEQTTMSLARQRCPDFTPEGVLARTGKTLLVEGMFQQQPAVAKLLTDDAPLWRRRFTVEAATYRMFATDPPPVAVPGLLSVDVDAGVLILSRVAGTGAASERHPTTGLSPAVSKTVVATVEAIATWAPPEGAFAAVFDYPERFSRYGPHGYGLLTGEDVTVLTHIDAALNSSVDAWAFAHGDALPSNMLMDAHHVTVVDWEWAGMYRPGYDHALLWTLLHHAPNTRAALIASASTGPWARRAGLWVNAAMTVAREIRIHRDLAPTPERERILTQLDRDLTAVRHELASLAEPRGR